MDFCETGAVKGINYLGENFSISEAKLEISYLETVSVGKSSF